MFSGAELGRKEENVAQTDNITILQAVMSLILLFD